MRTAITFGAGIAYLILLFVFGPVLARAVLGPYDPWQDATTGYVMFSIAPVAWVTWRIRGGGNPLPLRLKVVSLVVAILIAAGYVELAPVPTGPGSSTAGVAVGLLPGWVIFGGVLVDSVWLALERHIAARRA